MAKVVAHLQSRELARFHAFQVFIGKIISTSLSLSSSLSRKGTLRKKRVILETNSVSKG